MLRKESSEGVGYAVAELNEVRHVYAAAAPRCGGTLQAQMHDALQTIQCVMDEQSTRASIVQQAVFVRDLGQVDTCRAMIRDFYGPHMPATSFIPQPPCDGREVSIEAFGVGRGHDVEIQRCGDNLVICRHADVSWLHAADLLPDTVEGSVYDRSRVCFEKMSQLLARHMVRYDQVIRTWLYLGDIVGPEADTQRYKELNRARTDFYEHFQFCLGRTPIGFRGQVFPASTGIGTSGKGVMMACIAMDTHRQDIVLVPLENPQQTSAFDYGQHYSPKSPKFARAMAVVCGNSATIFVSGTASITASETRHIGDPRGQTNLTLDNIEALISCGNFTQHHVPGLGATLEDLALIRVYIKRQEDYAAVREVVRSRLGELPTIYAIGDVCRDDLLVEIEGVAMARR